MRVKPACELPLKCLKNKGKLVIVNLQKTPFDHFAEMIIRCRTDEFFQILMAELNVQIPEYKIEEDQIKRNPNVINSKQKN